MKSVELPIMNYQVKSIYQIYKELDIITSLFRGSKIVVQK